MSGLAEVRFAARDYLFRAGDPADRMYIVKEGLIDLLDAASEQVFATLGPGAPFGEQAVLAAGVRSASACARVDSICMELTAAGLQRILEEEKDLVRIVFRATLLQLYLHNALKQAA